METQLKYFPAFTLILLVSQLALAEPLASPDGCALSSVEQQNIIAQPVEVFDADESVGWRSFWKRGCQELTADLLQRYQAKNGRSYRVAFHEAQIRLTMGQSSGVRRLLFEALRHEMTSENPFRWNDYILGYIAFLDNDAEALKYYVGRLQARSDVRGNAMNALVLSKLLENLGKPYDAIFPRPLAVAHP